MDYLTEDTILPPDQKYVCLSFLTDKENNKTLSGIKIRGVFPSYELACEHAKKYQTIDPAFHVFVGECGKWLPFDPNPDSENNVKESEYANEQLNNMMKSYLENQEKSNLFYEQRKNEQIRQNIVENLNKRKDTLKDLEDKLKVSDKEYDKLTLESNIKSYEEQIKTMEEQKAEIDKKLELLTEDLNKFTT
jgi:hypothetical protein